MNIVVQDEIVQAQLRAMPSVVGRASYRAMNKAIASSRSQMVKGLAADMGLRQKDIRDRVGITKATVARQIAAYGTGTKRLPLMLFSARGPEPSRGIGNGVRYRLPSGRGVVREGFIATMRSGHKGVFLRAKALAKKSRGAWSKNLPILELFGPSVGRVFAKLRPAEVENVKALFDKYFAHELAYEASKVTMTESGGE